MDNIKTGRFIAQKRKEKKLTQKMLAQKIGVTDKAISKWERGLSYPDISLLIPLSEELGVSITEILNGDSIDKLEVELSDDIVVSSVRRYEKLLSKKNKRTFTAIMLVFFIFLMAIFMYGKEMDRRHHIDIAFSDLLSEVELSFDYGQELLSDKNVEACRCLDVSTSNLIRLLERYRSMLFMYYGEDVSLVESEFDHLRESFLYVHHAVPEQPYTDNAYSEDIENGLTQVVCDMESLKTALEKLNVYYGSEELLKNILQNLKNKEVVH